MPSTPELDVLFLCGGRGSRMGDLTRDRQKVMLPFRDKPILEYGLECAIDAFASANLIIGYGYLGKQIFDYFGNSWNGRELKYVYHEAGTEDRGALLSVRDQLSGGPFMIIHGNIIYNSEALVSNYEHQIAQRPISTLTLATRSDVSKHALVQVIDGKISEIAIPDPKDNSYDLSRHSIDLYDDEKEQRLIAEGWLRDMGINTYDPEFLDIIKKHTEPHMSHLFWILVNEFKTGSELGGTIYKAEWFHFQEVADLEYGDS